MCVSWWVREPSGQFGTYECTKGIWKSQNTKAACSLSTAQDGKIFSAHILWCDMRLQTFPITLVYCICFHKLPGFCSHLKVNVAFMWQLNRRLSLHSTFFNILSYLKGGETFAFCSVWWWCYDRRRQPISIYRSEHDSNGKEIRFPVLNAEYFAECLCPVGRPDPSLCLPSPSTTLNLEIKVPRLPPLCSVSCCVICRW